MTINPPLRPSEHRSHSTVFPSGERVATHSCITSPFHFIKSAASKVGNLGAARGVTISSPPPLVAAATSEPPSLGSAGGYAVGSAAGTLLGSAGGDGSEGNNTVGSAAGTSAGILASTPLVAAATS